MNASVKKAVDIINRREETGILTEEDNTFMLMLQSNDYLSYKEAFKIYTEQEAKGLMSEAYTAAMSLQQTLHDKKYECLKNKLYKMNILMDLIWEKCAVTLYPPKNSEEVTPLPIVHCPSLNQIAREEIEKELLSMYYCSVKWGTKITEKRPDGHICD